MPPQADQVTSAYLEVPNRNAADPPSQPPSVKLLRRPIESTQYAAGQYRQLLAKAGMKASMSRAGNCYDNAPMESFFHTLKVELVHQRRWTTRDEARRDLFSYVEGYYNRHRMHSALGYLSPEQAERKMAS
jgi:putative transposase